MSAPDPVRVMRAYDGELPPDEAREVLAAAEAQRAAEGLAQLGDVLRAMAEERGKAADDIADLVMARVKAENRQRTPVAPGPARYWPMLAAAAGVALAIGVYSATRTSPSSPALAVRSAVNVHQEERAAPPPPAGTLAEADSNADPEIAIESVDFGGKNGTIFMVPGGEQGFTPVVWLVDEPAERDRVEKL